MRFGKPVDSTIIHEAAHSISSTMKMNDPARFKEIIEFLKTYFPNYKRLDGPVKEDELFCYGIEAIGNGTFKLLGRDITPEIIKGLIEFGVLPEAALDDFYRIKYDEMVRDMRGFGYKLKELAGRIHGLYVRSADGKVIYLNRDRIAENLGDFKEVLGEDVTVEQVLRFLDGHETFHALIDKLLDEGVDLTEIDEVEEERLADTFGKAFSLGVTNIPQDLVDELDLLSKRLGIDLLNVLQRAPPQLEGLLEELGIDVRVETKTPTQMRDIRKEALERGLRVRADLVPVKGRDINDYDVSGYPYQELVTGPAIIKEEPTVEVTPVKPSLRQRIISGILKMPLISNVYEFIQYRKEKASFDRAIDRYIGNIQLLAKRSEEKVDQLTE